ncbi:SGNH/GDSL hydrolase family protein [Edaphobacillus lindanitolerans]|uniref:Lysophospholipase L1 n=1 Tax=Edaphobacillus lindanitolerans TaxID=550447 RepID=A0A1U7PLE6_9BACI|nr:SGNH/GDSL hydrolase family protein [Edaphobacillus lindanitolerans]SIT80568.1 Lysophospholipase L1 [Edaphobacillus lindanitolerans]
MKKRIVLLALTVILLAGCASGGPTRPFSSAPSPGFGDYEVPRTFVPRTVTLVGLGDSLTQGVGDERKRGGYPGRLAEEMNSWKGVKEVQIDNLAKRGRRSDQLVAQLKREEIQEEIGKADMITLTIGGNDVMKIVKNHFFDLKPEPFRKEIDPFTERLASSLFLIRKANPNAVLVVIGLYNPLTVVTDEESEMDSIITEWNEVLEDAAAADGRACFVPVQDLFVTNEDLVYHTDFFHPNAKGYERMTKRIEESLADCGLSELSGGELEF